MSGPVTIRHIDLRSPEPPVDSAGTSYNIFWWGDLPVGARMAYPEQTPYGKGQLDEFAAEFLAEQLAAREAEFGAPLRATYEGEAKHVMAFGAVRDLDRPLARMEALAKPGEGDAGQVSVILCTRDRLSDLAKCLASLHAQVDRPGEIVVVDNSAIGSAREWS